MNCTQPFWENGASVFWVIIALGMVVLALGGVVSTCISAAKGQVSGPVMMKDQQQGHMK